MKYIFSYAENQFYRERFDLPHEEILSLVRASAQENPENPIYDGIMICVALGGAVSVRLSGYRTKEVFFGQAEKVNIDPSKGHDLPLESKADADDYTNKVLIDTVTPEQLASLSKTGVPSALGRVIESYINGFPPTKIIKIQ